MLFQFQNNLENGKFRNRENLQDLITADSFSFSLFMRNNGKCNTSQICSSTLGNLSLGFANNTGEDQPAHPGSLINVFVIHSKAEETGLSLTFLETPKTGSLR